MASAHAPSIPKWSVVFPVLGLACLAAALAAPDGVWLHAPAAVLLTGSIFAAVHHAEIVAHRIGEPFGTIVLAVAVAAIELAMVLFVMTGGGAKADTMARDATGSAVILAINGIVGLGLILGALKNGEQRFRIEGAQSAVAVLIVLSFLALILPNFTSSAPGPFLSNAQMAFVAVACLALYLAFLFIQTVGHRDYFIMDETAFTGETSVAARMALIALGMMIAGLIAVVGLAKVLTPALSGALERLGAPPAALGVVIAVVVLAPEGVAALRAARHDRLQESLNLALGSALACIGLTIPAVIAFALATGAPLQLGFAPKEQAFLVVTLTTALSTLIFGRTTILQGAAHLAIAAAYIFFVFAP